MRLLLSLLLLGWVAGCSSSPDWNLPRCPHPVTGKSIPRSFPNVEAAPKWRSFDGTEFPYRTWAARGVAKPKAVVIMIGGWDSTTLDYTILGEHLAREGNQVYASELRTGVYDPVVRRRGNPKNWKEWVEDLRGFTTFVVKKHPGAPVFYHGHSFGSLVALSAGVDANWHPQIHGIIMESPALPLLLRKEDLIKMAVLFPFNGVRLPHLRMGPGAEVAPTGSEKLNCEWKRSPDRLREGYKLRYFTIAAELGYHVRALCGKVGAPVLALAGDKDVVVAPKPANQEEYRKYLREELCTGHAEVIDYPNGYHMMVVPKTGDPRLDSTSRKVLRDITNWIEQKRKVKEPGGGCGGGVEKRPTLNAERSTSNAQATGGAGRG